MQSKAFLFLKCDAMENNRNKKKETFCRRNKKHIMFLVGFTIVYLAIKYGYPFLKHIVCDIF